MKLLLVNIELASSPSCGQLPWENSNKVSVFATDRSPRGNYEATI